jgi:hypothetical protein
MKLPLRNSLILLISVWPSMLLAQPASQPAGSFAVTIQQAIGLKPGSGDILGPLATVISAVKKSGPDLDKAGYEAIDKLVAAINADADVDALEKQVVKQIRVSVGNGKFSPPAGWKYGSYIDIRQLSEKMYELAKPLKSMDEKKAAMYARASLILGAMTHFEGGAGMVRILIDDRQFASVSGLDDAQLRSLHEWVTKTDRGRDAYGEQLYGALAAEEKLISDKSGALDQANLTAGLSAMAAAWKEAGTDRSDKFMISWLAWEFLNMASLRHDEKAIGQIEAQIKSLLEAENDAAVQPWLKEALTIRGKNMPTSHIDHISG